ncbi:hypothetical protein XH89_15835 [Bradyrhizobium sp. CCBAU 53340]|uniref:restriction endonuclease n=1 Tax=Bradyrhizobium sp. CCBAU 53340 TaxID=1325112 RepID=UPI00188AF00C|nr:restriction endonuclease [Bradyrhizobium sp. CCBAU 53340]QOZ44781.1 hypothetical protein XH89_15835 [Bradyrhizobium sp. CCBAU 53340]
MSFLDGAQDDIFINRERELAWLSEVTERRGRTARIFGVGGIGKTALVRQFLKRYRSEAEAIVLAQSGSELDLDRVDYTLREARRGRVSMVVIEDVTLSAEATERLNRTVFNWKAIRSLILTSRPKTFGGERDTLHLGPLDHGATRKLLEALTRVNGPIPEAVFSLTGGLPLAIRLVAGQLETQGPDAVLSQLQGALYDLEALVDAPPRKLIATVKPKLIVVNEQILDRLKRRPQDIHNIDHRKFEEIVAELLDDMDFDVELTPATRDGGRDVLAYWNSPMGRLLCLVEAKKYRPDRPVGIQLVRQLYGTLVDERATSAMLVTTADFSPDARKFEQKHKWQISLKNYADLAEWIENYKKPKPKGTILP